MFKGCKLILQLSQRKSCSCKLSYLTNFLVSQQKDITILDAIKQQ